MTKTPFPKKTAAFAMCQLSWAELCLLELFPLCLWFSVRLEGWRWSRSHFYNSHTLLFICLLTSVVESSCSIFPKTLFITSSSSAWSVFYHSCMMKAPSFCKTPIPSRSDMKHRFQSLLQLLLMGPVCSLTPPLTICLLLLTTCPMDLKLQQQEC